MEKNALRKIKFKSLIEEWLQYKKNNNKRIFLFKLQIYNRNKYQKRNGGEKFRRIIAIQL